MKTKLFGVPYLIVLVLISSIPIANATITEEYEEDWFWTIGKYFTFKVRMVIETEPDEKWKTDTYYQVDYTITLTYLNESLSSREGFYLHFYSPKLFWSGGDLDFEVFENHTQVSWMHGGQVGTLTLKYKLVAGSSVDERLQIKGHIRYDIFKDYQLELSGASWTAPDPIWIDIEEHLTPDYIPPIIYICIGIAIVAIPIGAYFIFRRRKLGKTATN